MRLRTAAAISLLACLPTLATVQGEEILPGELEIEPLAEGVWLHVSATELETFGRVTGNGLVVLGDGAAAVIDTPWTEAQTAALFDWVEKRLGVRVTTVVPTHSHADCAGGLAEAHRRGARSYAHEKTAAFARRDGAEAPLEVFAESLDLEVGGRALKLEHAGAGHTHDNIVVWIADPGILFGGCLVRSARARGMGYTAEGDLSAWPRTIERLLEAYGDARVIVPGHGRPGGREHLDHTLELLRETAAKP